MEIELKIELQCLGYMQNNRAPMGKLNKLKLNWALCLLVRSHNIFGKVGKTVTAIFMHIIIIELLTRVKVGEFFCFSSIRRTCETYSWIGVSESCSCFFFLLLICMKPTCGLYRDIDLTYFKFESQYPLSCFVGSLDVVKKLIF